MCWPLKPHVAALWCLLYTYLSKLGAAIATSGQYDQQLCFSASLLCLCYKIGILVWQDYLKYSTKPWTVAGVTGRLRSISGRSRDALEILAELTCVLKEISRKYKRSLSAL